MNATTYTPEVNELYEIVLAKCKTLAAAGAYRTHITTWPVECTEETSVAVIDRLCKEQFAATTRHGFNASDTLVSSVAHQQQRINYTHLPSPLAVSWYNPCTGPCDAHLVQLLHPTMFKGFSETSKTVEATAQRLCDGVMEECNIASVVDGRRSYILNMSHIINAELERGMDPSLAEPVEQRLAQLLNDKTFTAVGLCQRATKYLRITW